MFSKLRNKLLITNMIIITTLVICCLSAIYITSYSFIKGGINTRLDNNLRITSAEADRRAASENSGYFPPPQDRPENGRLRRKDPPQDMFNSEIAVLCDKSGGILFSRTGFDEDISSYSDKIKEIAVSEKNSGSITLDVDSWAYKKIDYSDGCIIAFTKDGPEKGILLKLGLLLCAAAVVSVGASFIISLFSANRSIRPIEEAYNKQKQFVADASHELRTPLASIRANTDVLLDHENETISSEKKWLIYIKDEIDRLTRLTNDLLSLARSDANDKRQPLPPVSFSDTAESIALEAESEAFERNISFSSDTEENIYVSASPGGLKQLVLILIDNALKYTAEGGEINMSLKAEDESAVLTVINTGSINEIDLPHIFDRFYRADKSRSRNSGGYGLGLAIAQSICSSFNGTISAASQNNTVAFTVSLPLSHMDSVLPLEKKHSAKHKRDTDIL